MCALLPDESGGQDGDDDSVAVLGLQVPDTVEAAQHRANGTMAAMSARASSEYSDIGDARRSRCIRIAQSGEPVC